MTVLILGRAARRLRKRRRQRQTESGDGEAEIVLRTMSSGGIALRIDLQGDGHADLMIRLPDLDRLSLSDLIL